MGRHSERPVEAGTAIEVQPVAQCLVVVCGRIRPDREGALVGIDPAASSARVKVLLETGIMRREDVRLAARALDRITGRIDPEDVLGRIFSTFCIGK